ncbi:serine hydrolase domain-containing protein [Flagellimonas sp. 2504JD1-5]
MKTKFIIALRYISVTLFFFGLLFFQSCSSDDSEVITEIPKDLPSILDGILDERQSSNQPGLTVLVRKDGNIVYHESKGLARIQGNRPINSDTGFRIGSITKTFTALAIMQLVEQNLMSLEDKLLTVVPELSDAFQDITVAHLLTHRAGLLDYIDDNTNITSLDGLTTAQILDLIPISGLENLIFAPGSSAEYSNTGYVFLALIIERVSGMDYPTYMKTNIFDPMGMNNTFVISEKEHMGDANDNYALNFGTEIKVKGFNSLIYGASGIVSSTNDMNLFVEAVLGNDIIKEESLQTMVQPLSSISWLGDYGLGWTLGTGTNYWHQDANLTDSNDYWHIGGFDGYRSMLSFNPDLNLEVVILTNNGDASQEISNTLVRKVREYFKAN